MKKSNDWGFPESDWKLFRKKVPLWQERYMAQLNEGYIQLLSQDQMASEKFWALKNRMKKDAKKPGVMLEFRRSQMLLHLLELLNDKVIEPEDLEAFSDQLKQNLGLDQKD